jgi:hypothetical protein
MNQQKKTTIKTRKENPYFSRYTFDDVKLVDDSKSFLAGSNKQYIHLATFTFRTETFILFCEAAPVVEYLNKNRLGDDVYGFLTETKLLQPSLYIEKVKYYPRTHDQIETYLDRINDEDLFQFLLEFVKSMGIINEFQIKGKITK